MHRLTNVLMYAITDITTWGADMPLMVGHMSAQGHTLTFSNLSVFHGGNCSFFTGIMNILQLLIMITKYKHPKACTALARVC